MAQRIKLLLLDVDGVLTDGLITYNGEQQESKSFNIHDGLGIKLLQRNGVEVGIITGRTSTMVEYRAKELGIDILIQGREDKAAAMKTLLSSLGMEPSDVAYMGDDLPDLAAIQYAGLGIAPANAVIAVREQANLVTSLGGGHGAVREAAEFILAAKNLLDAAVEEYRG